MFSVLICNSLSTSPLITYLNKFCCLFTVAFGIMGCNLSKLHGLGNHNELLNYIDLAPSLRYMF